MDNTTLFSQIIRLLPKSKFTRLVAKHQTDKHCKGLDSWTHLVAMIFCQFGAKDSLRSICQGLLSATGNLVHLGIARAPTKSGLSYNNEHRNAALFEEYFHEILALFHAPKRRKGRLARIKSPIKILDATVISLCIAVFDWAKYRTSKGGIKMHTLIDYDAIMPEFVSVSCANVADNVAAKQVSVPRGAVVVADRGYADGKLLVEWHKAGVFFVVRIPDTWKVEWLNQESINKDLPANSNIQKAGKVKMESGRELPPNTRLVEVWDPVNKSRIRLLTNHSNWTAATISELYKCRWQIESLFKQIKQHLRIKSFVGTSENALRIQIWTALISILLLQYLKAMANFDWHMSNLVSFIRLNLFVKINLLKWLHEPFLPPPKKPPKSLQLDLNF
jgi:Transposase DDE domain/Domain of unknown function (DUF4372)